MKRNGTLANVLRGTAVLTAAVAAHYAGYRLASLWLDPAVEWPVSLAWFLLGGLLLWALVKSSWTMRIGLVVSAACLAVFLQGVDFGGVGAAFLGIRPFWILPAVAAGMGLYLVKAYRWRILLAPVKRLGFWRLFRASAIGFMANVILPGRVGEFIRAGAVSVRRDVRVTSVFATIMVERVFDVVGLVFYFVVSLSVFGWTLTRTGATPRIVAAMAGVRWVGFIFLLGSVGACAFLVALKLFPEAMTALADRLMRFGLRFVFGSARVLVAPLPRGTRGRLRERLDRLARAVDERLHEMLQGFVQGLTVITGVGQTLWLSVLTLIHWALAILTTFFVGLCFPAMDLGLTGSMLIFVVTGFAVAMPQAPGFVGVFHLATEVSCRAMAMAGAGVLSTIKSFAIVLWFVVNVPVIIGGFVCLWIEGLSLRDLKERGEAGAHAEGETPAPAASEGG